MKKILPVCAALLLGCSMGAWAQSMDMNFAKAAAAGGMAEVKLGQLAADKGSSDFVKQFGQKMVDDHGKANDNLKSIAQKDSITLPTDIMPKDQALYDRLSKLSGAAFDSAYIKAMTMDHKKDIAAFTKESTMGKNADVKDFATTTLPTVKGHLQMLETKKMM
jgi:putative membrane protein